MARVEAGLGLHSWQFESNITQCNLCRILVGWDTRKISVTVIHSDPQWLTCDVKCLLDGTSIRTTFIYGDFNAIISFRDRKGGDPRWHNHMDDFSNCVAQTELIQIPVSGLHFTWHNGRQDNSPILLSLSPPPPRQKPRFKFLNLWAEQEGYEDTVKAAWESEVWGNPISRLTSKLHNLKGYLKLHHGHLTNSISDKARAAKEN
ncbi:hypothetical protein OIU85_017872 [Salix viminalis]|uniref:Endonuclease/exonuclease/phosphatase domain-containing protein n=1 Tax=Salix viminalis TaxID=40686 RepID=A0A9Q0USI4_SALVM|nr:hypothetical protein OIU85_017872 [Salix viminalis]